MMKTRNMVGMAWENLKKRKLRTSLTTLGVIIGITTIIGLASLGEGLRHDVNQRLQQGFELDVLIVIPGSFASGLRGFGFHQGDVANITTIQNVTLVTPMITLPTADVTKVTNNEKLGAFTVGAINFTEMQGMLPQRFRLLSGGHFPNATEKYSMVLGNKAATLSNAVIAGVGDNVTLSMRVTINYPNYTYTYTYQKNYTITGILAEGGTSGLTNFDYWAFIPLQTAEQISGIGENFQIILAKITDPKVSDDVSNAIESKFPQYSITVFVPSSFVRQVDNILNLITIFLLAVASISLLVAGVGIMNIMTVSVMERTREIGILKAIGARSRTVLSMFLTETILIGLMGGIIGILSGYGLSYVLAYGLSGLMQFQQQNPNPQGSETQGITITPIFSPEWTIIALLFAILVCVIFGLYPARKAAKLDPVQALRYE